MGVLDRYFNFKNRYLFAFGMVLCTSMLWAVFGFAGNNDFDRSRRGVLLRKIGHELLLRSGDATSRVLPVEQPNDHTYRIRFEQKLSFETDSLVKIVGAALDNENFANGYIVNVLNCSGEVVYGYEIGRNIKSGDIACKGRIQPKDCYVVEIKFEPGMDASQKSLLIGGIPLLAFVSLLAIRKGVKPFKKPSFQAIQIGNTLFDYAQRILTINNETVTLTAKEASVLKLLAERPNQVIERSRLQKEIWEDEGVIVGRSLDMFISRLRKKLEADESVEIKNVHGKGYVLGVTD